MRPEYPGFPLLKCLVGELRLLCDGDLVAGDHHGEDGDALRLEKPMVRRFSKVKQKKKKKQA